MIRIEGMDKLERDLTRLAQNLDELDGEHCVPFPELFPPKFMAVNTSFATIEEMLGAKGLPGEAELEQLADDEWNRFVVETTRFDSWEEMRDQGVEQWVSGKLDL